MVRRKFCRMFWYKESCPTSQPRRTVQYLQKKKLYERREINDLKLFFKVINGLKDSAEMLELFKFISVKPGLRHGCQLSTTTKTTFSILP